MQKELKKLVDGSFHYYLNKTGFSDPVPVKCPNNQLTSQTKNLPKKKILPLFTPGKLPKGQQRKSNRGKTIHSI